MRFGLFSMFGFALLSSAFLFSCTRLTPTLPTLLAATVTDTPTLSGTLVPTNTPTITSTPTATSTGSPAVTATATPSNRVYGTASYTGSLGSVSAAHPIVAFLSQSSSLYPPQYSAGAVNSSGGNYSLPSPGSGNVYLVCFYSMGTGVTCDDLNWSLQVKNGAVPLHQGDPLGVYGSAIPGTGAQNVNFSFNDTSVLPGYKGTIDYNGSLGAVGIPNDIHILSYKDSAYSIPEMEEALTCNNTHYSIEVSDNTKYLQVYYDKDGSGTLSSGDPYLNLGTGSPSASASMNVTFGDTYIK